jgi:hypothetical protein
MSEEIRVLDLSPEGVRCNPLVIVELLIVEPLPLFQPVLN